MTRRRTMTDRLSDADLDRLEDLMVKRQQGRGNTPDVQAVLALLAEVRAARAREARVEVHLDD